MSSSERPSPEPILKKEASPAVLGGENSGSALEASNALNYRAWGIPAVLSREISGNALRAFRGLSGIFPEFLPESPSRTGGMAQAFSGERGEDRSVPLLSEKNPQNEIHEAFPQIRFPENPQKRDARLKNEIGMKSGDKVPPPLTCSGCQKRGGG